MPGARTIIYLLILFSCKLAVAQQYGSWELIQTIPAHGREIHATAYAPHKLAINIDNQYIEYYSYFNKQFHLDKVYQLKWIWDEFGTMKFVEDYLFVSIDGFKFYKIDLVKDRISKTNTYKAGFYIISRYDIEYYSEDKIFKINESGDLEVWINKDYYLKLPPTEEYPDTQNNIDKNFDSLDPNNK